MICPNCGRNIGDLSTSCFYCGQEISKRSGVFGTQSKYKSVAKSKKNGKLLTVISVVLMILAYAANASEPSGLWYVMFFVGAFLFAFNKYRQYKSSLPSDALAIRIRDKLESESNDFVRFISNKVLIARTVLTLILIAVLFVFANAVYYKSYVFFWCTWVFLIYFCAIIKKNTFSAVYDAASKSPEVSLSDIFDKETYNEVDFPKIKTALLICGVALVVAVGFFIKTNMEPRFVFEEVDNQIVLVEYKPGIRNMRDEVIIPEKYKEKPVVSIGKRVFEKNIYIESVSMPDTVKTIEVSAFDGCTSLESVYLSKDLECIEGYAFASCTSLKKINLPEKIDSIWFSAFCNCESLESITIPVGVTEIDDELFSGCESLKNINLHNGITEIGCNAFSSCEALEKITLPEKIKEIPDSTFEYCTNLKEIVIPSGVESIGEYAFYCCESLARVIVPESVKEIKDYAFEDCTALESIVLPKGITLWEGVFDEDVNIKYVKINE